MVYTLEDMTLSPSEVREMLGLDNSEILKLCKKASIVPKRNHRGLTYFSYNEVKHLQQIKKARNNGLNLESKEALNNILNSFSVMENNISNNILKIVDEKLKDIEELSTEIAKLQGENEALKEKISKVSKENYYLKNEILSYKPLGLGMFVRVKKDYSL